MSLDTKAAIVARLEGDEALAALLGADPNDSAVPPRRAIFNARMSMLTLTSAAYPCITFREAIGAEEPSLKPTPSEVITSGTVDRAEERHERFEFEIWSLLNDAGAQVDAVYKRLSAQLDGVAFVTDGGARVYRCVESTKITDSFDKDLKQYFAAVAYTLEILYPA